MKERFNCRLSAGSAMRRRKGVYGHDTSRPTLSGATFPLKKGKKGPHNGGSYISGSFVWTSLYGGAVPWPKWRSGSHPRRAAVSRPESFSSTASVTGELPEEQPEPEKSPAGLQLQEVKAARPGSC